VCVADPNNAQSHFCVPDTTPPGCLGLPDAGVLGAYGDLDGGRRGRLPEDVDRAAGWHIGVAAVCIRRLGQCAWRMMAQAMLNRKKPWSEEGDRRLLELRALGRSSMSPR